VSRDDAPEDGFGAGATSPALRVGAIVSGALDGVPSCGHHESCSHACSPLVPPARFATAIVDYGFDSAPELVGLGSRVRLIVTAGPRRWAAR
jgi:hypothetical protein